MKTIRSRSDVRPTHLVMLVIVLLVALAGIGCGRGRLMTGQTTAAGAVVTYSAPTQVIVAPGATDEGAMRAALARTFEREHWVITSADGTAFTARREHRQLVLQIGVTVRGTEGVEVAYIDSSNMPIESPVASRRYDTWVRELGNALVDEVDRPRRDAEELARQQREQQERIARQAAEEQARRDRAATASAPSTTVWVSGPGASATVSAPGASAGVSAPGASASVSTPGASVWVGGPGGSASVSGGGGSATVSGGSTTVTGTSGSATVSGSASIHVSTPAASASVTATDDDAWGDE